MASRLDLQSKLEEILGNRNVYYQPPTSLAMSYPAIVYSLNNININPANDKNYIRSKRYELTLIDKLPDNKCIDKLLDLPTCKFDRHFKSDNLNHYTFTLYY